jgi:hypothetical protein
MDELKIAIAEPFRRRGKARLTPAEFTFALTLELKWLTPDESRMLIEEGLKAGLLRDEKGKIAPTFDYRSIAVPAGYRPGVDIFGKKTLLDRIVGLLASTGISEAEALELIRQKQTYLCDLVTPEAAGLILAKEKGLDTGNYIDEALAEILGK